MFKRYKQDECLDKTNVLGDFSVMGAEFINFFSAVAACRIIRKATKAGISDNMNYADMTDDLSGAWRKTDAPVNPKTDDVYRDHTNKDIFE